VGHPMQTGLDTSIKGGEVMNSIESPEDIDWSLIAAHLYGRLWKKATNGQDVMALQRYETAALAQQINDRRMTLCVHCEHIDQTHFEGFEALNAGCEALTGDCRCPGFEPALPVDGYEYRVRKWVEA
jgi:hypothetical protein